MKRSSILLCLLSATGFLLGPCSSSIAMGQTPETTSARTAVDTIVVRDVDTVATPPDATLAVDRTYWKEQRAKRRAPRNTFELSLGYGWITSHLYSSNGSEIDDKGGTEWKLSYDRVFGPGLGFGLYYSGYYGTVGIDELTLHYIAPAFVGRHKFGNFILKYGVGVGCFLYDDGFMNLTRMGFHYEIGAEYMVGKHIGLGISNSCVLGTMPDNDLIQEDFNGIVRVNIMGGLRFYF